MVVPGYGGVWAWCGPWVVPVVRVRALLTTAFPTVSPLWLLHHPPVPHCGYCTTPLYPTVAPTVPPLWLPLYLHCGPPSLSGGLPSLSGGLPSLSGGLPGLTGGLPLASLVVSRPHWWFSGLTRA